MIDIDKLRQALGAVQPEEVEELLDRLEAAESARRDDYQNWMTALDRNAELLAKLEAAEKERDNLRTKVERMEQQEADCEVIGQVRNVLYEVRTLKYDLPAGTKLYALPGAQPASSVPEDVMRDAERYRYLRARDDGTAGVGCWIEADGRVCDRGWLYGVQLDSAIDSFIEVLAAAPEAKP